MEHTSLHTETQNHYDSPVTQTTPVFLEAELIKAGTDLFLQQFIFQWGTLYGLSQW